LRIALGSDERSRLTDFVEAELRRRGHDVELFGPPLQPGEFEQRIRRLQDSDLFEVGSLRTEVQFLLLGLRGIYLMSRAIRANLKGPERNCVRTAVSRFEKRLPEPLLLRNIHEHLDEYILGEGTEPVDASCGGGSRRDD